MDAEGLVSLTLVPPYCHLHDGMVVWLPPCFSSQADLEHDGFSLPRPACVLGWGYRRRVELLTSLGYGWDTVARGEGPRHHLPAPSTSTQTRAPYQFGGLPSPLLLLPGLWDFFSRAAPSQNWRELSGPSGILIATKACAAPAMHFQSLHASRSHRRGDSPLPSPQTRDTRHKWVGKITWLARVNPSLCDSGTFPQSHRATRGPGMGSGIRSPPSTDGTH